MNKLNGHNSGEGDSFTGPDEGGARGENTPFAGGYDRQPSQDMVDIDKGIHDFEDTEAGPNSDADTLIDDAHASDDNRA